MTGSRHRRFRARPRSWISADDRSTLWVSAALGLAPSRRENRYFPIAPGGRDGPIVADLGGSHRGGGVACLKVLA